MSILEKFTSATEYASMPMGERILATVYIALLGMGITFTVLIFLLYCFKTMSSVLKIKLKSEAKPWVTKSNVNTESKQLVVEEKTEDDEELTAVITAAVALLLNQTIDTFVVRNIEQLPDLTPAWSKAGRIEQMSSRR